MGGKIPLLVLPWMEVANIAAQMPTKALADYFGALGYPLSFQIGDPLDKDPTDHPENIPPFCRSVAPPPDRFPWPGVVLVSDMSVEGPSTNGTLLDMDRRGASAVFTKSTAFRKGDNEARFEIYAHEIGHMLNLSHTDANDTFPTAMNQWDDRSIVDDRAEVWRQAIQQGSPLQTECLPEYFNSGKRRPLGLPMSADCCKWLAGAPQTDVFPWGGKFKDLSVGGVDDQSIGLIDCYLAIESEGSVAQPVDLQVRISARSIFEAIEIPATVDLRSGVIEIHITSPAGITRKYRCRSLTCGTSRQRLERGRIIRRNYSLVGDANGILFPVAGIYQIEAVLPTLGARSGPVEYNIRPATGPFANPAFQQFLANDLPNDDLAGWCAVDEALDSRDVGTKTKSFLRSKAAARGHRFFMPLEELRREASSRVQERDALLRVVRLRQALDRNTSELKRAVDDAEDIFRATDMSNPSIQYLEHVRQRADVKRHNKEK
ncbi:hypothetical protein [Pseudomonas frederiksbergensis]|uniref:Peptidase M10 metallopeptidase domain-containing protein n=1 Tax=Pseudomonas frederiksbergensis TaxID=104087 RepID=A0AB33EMX1_9PSED|nr:hypothetical protein [Pseudomonas frederiksbergensis]ATE80471.1 hypothetical protein CNN82_30225 [Pseudomonas frederiksbergensis]